MAEPADQARDLVGGNPHGEVGDREDRLIEHQDEDDGAAGNADRSRKPRQIDAINRPAEREHELKYGKIEFRWHREWDASVYLAVSERRGNSASVYSRCFLSRLSDSKVNPCVDVNSVAPRPDRVVVNSAKTDFPMPRGYVLVVLAALSAFNFLDQQLMSILLEPVRHEFGLNDTRARFALGLRLSRPCIRCWAFRPACGR